MQATPATTPGEAAHVRIQIDTRQRQQSVIGFGAALTDASAMLFQHSLTAPTRSALLQELFGRTNEGLGLDLVRLTIGASDFSSVHYSLDDPPDAAPDPALHHFDISRNLADVVPITRQALDVNPELRIIASPWSAPAWMKSSDSLIRGSLRPEYEATLAAYLIRYVDAYAAQGIRIWALTLQNEPAFEPGNYPGMRMPAEQRARIIGRHLGPALAARERGSSPLILEWDHNWDAPQEPLQVLADPDAARFVAGVAWHCYAGAPGAQRLVREAHPDKFAILSECSGGDWEPVRSGGLLWLARNLILDTLANGASGVVLWNLALDEAHGPHLGGCGNCRGVVTINRANGAIERNDEYWALAHFSRFVRRGAVHVEASTRGGTTIHPIAFLNTDGSRVLVVTNEHDAPRSLDILIDGERHCTTLPARSVATLVWPGNDAKPDAATHDQPAGR